MSVGMQHKMMVEIERQVAAEVTTWVPSVAELTQWVDVIAKQRQQPLWLTVRMVGAAESHQLNANYRGQDKPTNVLSFGFEAPPGYPSYEPYIGDLVICAEVVEMEAEDQHKMPEHHWAHLVIHGTLHLLGYDHEAPDAASEMEALEVRYLAELNINNPYETAS